MPRMFKLPPGTAYPATAEDLKSARQGRPYKQATPKTDKPVALPYPEIEASWIEQGAKEVRGSGIQER